MGLYIFVNNFIAWLFGECCGRVMNGGAEIGVEVGELDGLEMNWYESFVKMLPQSVQSVLWKIDLNSTLSVDYSRPQSS
jgi:hypothetical protein